MAFRNKKCTKAQMTQLEIARFKLKKILHYYIMNLYYIDLNSFKQHYAVPIFYNNYVIITLYNNVGLL